MTHDERERLQKLQNSWADRRLVTELYGLDPLDDQVMVRVRAWAKKLSRNAEVERPGFVNRHVLENFFQMAAVLPLKWAAAQLGMQPHSLEEVLLAVAGAGLIEGKLVGDGQVPSLLDVSIIKTFYRNFPGLRDRIFADHDDYCRRLHRELLKEYGVRVEPLKCVTATHLLGAAKADYAYQYDVITLQPIGLRYQVWLDFHKPLNLRPDACSTLFYAAEQRTLKRYLLGAQPEIPRELLPRSK